MGHDMYTIHRFIRLAGYMRSNGTTDQAILLITPIPAIIVMVAMDALPLAPPSKGFASSAMTWVRDFLFSIVVCSTILLQLRTMIPAFHVQWHQGAVITLIVSVVTILYTVVAAYYIGYPLPFTINACSPVFLPVYVVSVVAVFKRQYREYRTELRQYFTVFLFQSTFTMIYPALGVGFASVEGGNQVAVALLIQLTKAILKHVMKRLMRAFPDFSALFVILNVEVYHALFVSICMQNSSSAVATILLVALDVGGAIKSLVLFERRAQALRRLLPAKQATDVPTPVVHVVAFLLLDPTIACRFSSISPTSTQVRPSSAVLPDPVIANVPSDGAALSLESLQLSNDLKSQLKEMTREARIEFVRQSLQLLYRTEMFLLTEYVEVIVPFIYCVYLSAIYQFPNRAYHSDMKDLSPSRMRQTIMNVVGYTLLQLLSFLPLGWILRKRLGFDALRQLVCSVRSEWWLVQAKLVTWLMFTMHASIEQYGVDYTFKFKWLKQQPVT